MGECNEMYRIHPSQEITSFLKRLSESLKGSFFMLIEFIETIYNNKQSIYFVYCSEFLN